jgi:menaquinone-9 beta-reductase
MNSLSQPDLSSNLRGNPCGESYADLFVVGGGPAGLATAILAAEAGMRVVVADHSRPPIDKACGEGLMPDTVAAVEKLGVKLHYGKAVRFLGIRFNDGEGKTCAAATFANGFGLGLRRTELHSGLVQRAADVGVELLWGARVTLEREGGLSCDGRPVRCRYAIGADGGGSPVRRWAALEGTRYERARFGIRQHFGVEPWSDFVEVYWARDCQIVAAPIAHDEVCVAVTSRNPLLKFHDAVGQVPELADRLSRAPATNKLRGARTSLRRLKRVYRGAVALVGDASGSVDPLTGEGIGLGLRQAAALVEAIKRSDLHWYQAAHERIGRMSHLTSRLMLFMDRHPQWRSRVLRTLAAEPALFARMLNAQVGELALSECGLDLPVRLGWRLIFSW